MIAGKDGEVLLCQHTNRRIVRVGKDLKMTPFLEKFEGKRFNSPNDLAYKSDGSLYFTDPPYGLLKQDDDPAKELKFNGVFRYARGKVQLVVKDLTRPNGLAFSPDEKTFYVANSDEKHKVWMRYDVAADGSVSGGRVFADVTAEKEDGLPDGMKVDSQGQHLRRWPGGRVGIRTRRQAPGHHQAARDSGELQLGRRRQNAVHHGADRRVPHQACGGGAEAGLLDEDRYEAKNILEDPIGGGRRAGCIAGRGGRTSDSGAPGSDGGSRQRKGDVEEFGDDLSARGLQTAGIHRCQNVEGAYGAHGQSPGRSQLPVRADVSERRDAAEVGGFGRASESVAHHREHALDEELHRDSIRRELNKGRKACSQERQGARHWLRWPVRPWHRFPGGRLGKLSPSPLSAIDIITPTMSGSLSPGPSPKNSASRSTSPTRRRCSTRRR